MSSENQNSDQIVEGQSVGCTSHEKMKMNDVQDRIEKEKTRKSIYKAAANGDITDLKSYPDTGTFESRGAKNSILHLFIIAQSKSKPESSDKNEIKKALHDVTFKDKDKEAGKPKEDAPTTVRSILHNWPCLLRKPNKAGDSPLHVAARHGLYSIAEALLKCGAESKDVERGGNRGEEVVRMMLYETNTEGETAMHQAVRYQHSEVVKKLLMSDEKCEVEYGANNNGETPLYMAAERGNNELVKQILNKYNLPAYQGPNGRTALHAAALHSSKPDDWTCIVKKEGLEILATQTDNQGKTPLHYEPSMIKCESYDPFAAFVVDHNGKTALHIAALKGYKGLVEKFLEICPECFELEDNFGRNVLHYAVESGNEGTVDVILKSEYLSDLVKKKDENGHTPLHLLAIRRFHMPKLINDHRIDKMAFDMNQFNPRDMILANSIREEIELNLEDSMKKCGIDLGKRAVLSDCKLIKSKDEENKKSNEGDDSLTEVRQNHLVVVALIATVTFAAGFTLPGGYIQQDGPNLGYAVLTKQTAFKAFVLADTLAMVLSCAAVFIHLLIAMHKEEITVMNQKKEKLKNLDKDREMVKMVQEINKRKTMVSELFNKSLPLTLIAIVAMVFAFVSGTYAVLEHSPPLAIAATVTGCLFFYLFCYLWAGLYTTSKSTFYRFIEFLAKAVTFIWTVFVLLPIWLVCKFLFDWLPKLLCCCCPKKAEKPKSKEDVVKH